jgi:hypothetical protein
MSCAELQELAAELALDLVTGAERAAALAHLEGCPPCRAEVASLTDVGEALLAIAPEVSPSPGFESRVISRIAALREVASSDGGDHPRAGGPPTAAGAAGDSRAGRPPTADGAGGDPPAVGPVGADGTGGDPEPGPSDAGGDPDANTDSGSDTDRGSAGSGSGRPAGGGHGSGSDSGGAGSGRPAAGGHGSGGAGRRPRSRPGRRRRARRRAALVGLGAVAAVAAVVLAAILAVGRGGGSEAVAADLRTPAGRVVGQATVRDADPAVVTVEMGDWARYLQGYDDAGRHSYWLRIDTGGGNAEAYALPLDESGSWQVTLDGGDAAGAVTSVAVVDETGHVWCDARFAAG